MDQIMTFDEIKKLSMEANERRNELLDSIRNMHGDHAAAVAMAVAEFHVMMSLIERMVHADNADADDDDMQHKLLRSTACQLMRASVLQRTIIPLLETTTVPEEHFEDYSKITQKLVESLHDTLNFVWSTI